MSDGRRTARCAAWFWTILMTKRHAGMAADNKQIAVFQVARGPRGPSPVGARGVDSWLGHRRAGRRLRGLVHRRSSGTGHLLPVPRLPNATWHSSH